MIQLPSKNPTSECKTPLGNILDQTITAREDELEIVVMYPQAKHLGPGLDEHQELGEMHGMDSFSGPPEGTNPANALISIFWLWEQWEDKFLLF